MARSRSINVQRAALQNTALGDDESVRLSTSYVTSENGVNLNLTLSADDLNAIKAIPDLGTMMTDTFLSFEATFATDAFDNLVMPRPSTNGLQAATVVDDLTAPSLSSYTYDLDSSVLTLTFSEIVDIETFDASLLTFVGPSNVSLTPLMLTASDVTTTIDSSQIEIQILPPNSYSIQLEPRYTEGIEVDANATTDLSTAAQQNVEETVYNGAIIPDTTSPLLTDFNLDLSNGTLLFTFNEAVDATSIQFDQIHIQNAPFNATESISLTTASSANQTSANVVEVVIGQEDFDQVRAAVDLACPQCCWNHHSEP